MPLASHPNTPTTEFTHPVVYVCVCSPSFLSRLATTTTTRTPSIRKRRLIPPTRQLGRLNRHDLLLPRDGATLSAHGSDLIGAEAGDADIPLAFEHELDVADFQAGGTPQLGQLAGGRDDVVDEVVGGVEDDL